MFKNALHKLLSKPALFAAAPVGLGMPALGTDETIVVTAYTAALAELTTALGTAIPVVAVAALGIGAGLIVLRIGVRLVKRFAAG
jgi:hypothetical protein